MGELDLRREITENLRSFERLESAKPLIAAAVGIVLVTVERDFAVPIFQRTSSMTRHAGQMALPGGRRDEGETPEQCAIREIEEELGFTVDESDVLGRLDDFDTMSGFTITPVVLWSGVDFKTLQPSEAEVARLVLISIGELKEAARAAAAGDSTAFSMRFRAVEVFAPTAAILYQFCEVALEGRPTRVASFYQPPFTHR